jgi:hypothetical protein
MTLGSSISPLSTFRWFLPGCLSVSIGCLFTEIASLVWQEPWADHANRARAFFLYLWTLSGGEKGSYSSRGLNVGSGIMAFFMLRGATVRT